MKRLAGLALALLFGARGVRGSWVPFLLIVGAGALIIGIGYVLTYGFAPMPTTGCESITAPALRAACLSIPTHAP
jgi:peptidoglycan/LPS O-acetylase OafA/YrhL